MLAKKPKRRVEWVQKRLKEDLAITHRDSVYEVLVRKEGRAFAADISGADCVRTYNAVLAAIELFTTKQQKRLQADTFLLRKIHTQEQERQKAAQAKAKAAVKRPTKDPPASLQRPPATKDSPKVAAKRMQSPDPQVPDARPRSTSPPTANVLSSEPKSERRSESPDWIPRTPPQAPPKEPRKTTGSWTTIFQDPKEEKLSSSRKESSTAEGGTKKEEETKESTSESDEESSSSSTEYDAFTAGPEQVAVTSPSRNQDEGTTQSLQSPDRPSEPPAKSAVKRAARSSSSERSASTKKNSVVSKPDGSGPSKSTRLENADSAPSPAPQRSGSDLVEKSKEAKNKAETETEPCGSPGSDSDSDSSEDSADNVDSKGIAEGMAVNTLDDQNNVEGEQGEPGEQEEQPGSSESDSDSQADASASQAPEPEVAPTQPEEEQEPPVAPQVTSTPLRRQPPPPPLPRRLLAEAEASEPLRWRYIAPDGQERLAIRAYPGIDAPTTGGSLGSGEVFTVNQETPGDNGVLFLRLADGRGWVFNRKSGLSRRRKTRPLCVPYQVSLVDEQGPGKVRKRLPRPANAHPKAKRRRRRQHAVVDPYMVTGTVIEVDSDGDAPKAPAGGNMPKAAKESLRVQLERKQQEVEALRQKLLQLNTQQELGKKRSTRAPEGDPVAPKRTAQAAKLQQDADDKRRELQAILTKKRAISAAGQKQTPRFVD